MEKKNHKTKYVWKFYSLLHIDEVIPDYYNSTVPNSVQNHEFVLITLRSLDYKHSWLTQYNFVW